jgi:drug/metabolite transporter (DMT)-like permease
MGRMPVGIAIALLSAVLFGASTPLAKMLLGNVSPWAMAGLLYLGAGLGLATVHLSRNALRLPAIEAPLRRSDLPWLAAVITAGGIVGPLFLMFARMQLARPCCSIWKAWPRWA